MIENFKSGAHTVLRYIAWFVKKKWCDKYVDKFPSSIEQSDKSSEYNVHMHCISLLNAIYFCLLFILATK